MDGVLTLNKPAGWTSQDAVTRVRRLLKEKRAGHAGTLDPDATGVLVIALGQATRLLPHLPLEPKVYRAVLALGTATTTEDASGEVTAEADASGVTAEALAQVLPSFLGELAQVPPMVSALHHNGQRLYDLARQGITVEREARTVQIHSLVPLDFTPGARATATLRVSCGGGTYIRTLCKDIGVALGLPAHMAALEREVVGPFTLDTAVTLETLTPDAVVPMERALPWPTIPMSDDDRLALQQGRTIPRTDGTIDEAAALYEGRLLALLRADGALWQPFKVFAL